MALLHVYRTLCHIRAPSCATRARGGGPRVCGCCGVQAGREVGAHPGGSCRPPRRAQHCGAGRRGCRRCGCSPRPPAPPPPGCRRSCTSARPGHCSSRLGQGARGETQGVGQDQALPLSPLATPQGRDSLGVQDAAGGYIPVPRLQHRPGCPLCPCSLVLCPTADTPELPLNPMLCPHTSPRCPPPNPHCALWHIPLMWPPKPTMCPTAQPL